MEAWERKLSVARSCIQAVLTIDFKNPYVKNKFLRFDSIDLSVGRVREDKLFKYPVYQNR